MTERCSLWSCHCSCLLLTRSFPDQLGRYYTTQHRRELLSTSYTFSTTSISSHYYEQRGRVYLTGLGRESHYSIMSLRRRSTRTTPSPFPCTAAFTTVLQMDSPRVFQKHMERYLLRMEYDEPHDATKDVLRGQRNEDVMEAWAILQAPDSTVELQLATRASFARDASHDASLSRARYFSDNQEPPGCRELLCGRRKHCSKTRRTQTCPQY